MEGRPEAEVKDIRKRAESYLACAEEIKKRAKTEKVQSKQQVKYLHIPEGATGYSYYTIFNSCLEKGGVTWVEVEDPYIRYNHQVHNFVRFCEMLVKHCLPMLKSVSLLTGVGEVAADPPTVPLRRGNSRTPSGSPNQSRPTSLTSSGEATDDGPRPPPRVASVCNVGTGLSKSKSVEVPSKEGFEKTSPAASPNHNLRREGNSGPGPDSSPLRSVKDIAAGLNRDSEPVPPPVPKKMHKQQSSLQALKNGES